MNKLRNILKAIVIFSIVLGFVTSGTALFDDIQTKEINKQLQTQLNQKLGLSRGWEEQASGFWDPSRGIRYMHALDENTAWAVGYDGSGSNIYETIFTHTSNGGELWEADLIFSDTGYGLGNICGLDDTTAYAAVFSTSTQDENCGIYKTTDGGNSWTQLFEGPYSFANNVYFWDENDGVCLGDLLDDYFEVYTTSDGGINWNRVPEEDFSGEPVDPTDAGWTGCIDFVGDTVLFGTHKGIVYKSDDRGYTWVASYTGMGSGGLNPGVNEIAFKDSNNGLAAHDNGATYDLYETGDGGATWTQITPSGTAYASGLSFLPGTDNFYISTGAASGYSGASYSTDGGHTWTDFGEVAGTQLLSCDFVEGMIGWAGAFNTDDETGGVYKYSPSGESDLLCEGSLSWVDVKPGDTVTGTFTVKNIGGAGTELDWEVDDDPSWGDWAFDPESGVDLTPEDEAVTVEVTCTAPDDKNQEFSGKIKVVNSENSDDYCYIDVSLTTPMSKQFSMLQVLQNILQHFPILEKILTFVNFMV